MSTESIQKIISASRLSQWVEMVSQCGNSHASRISAFSSAVHYAQKQWKYLPYYPSRRRLEIINNCAERSIKPFAIDRNKSLLATRPEEPGLVRLRSVSSRRPRRKA